MQRRLSLLPTGRKRVKLAAGGSSVISHVAVGQQLNDKYGNYGNQEDMNVTALMEDKL
jgi:hypothetical protein